MIGLMGASCTSADDHDRAQTNSQMSYFSEAIPVPRLRNSIQRQMWAHWYGILDDPNLTMYTTVKDQRGNVTMTMVTRGPCIPQSTQLTNPMRYESQGLALPQPEPNALFMGGTNATVCFGVDGNIVTTEDNVTSSLFPTSTNAAGTIVTTGNKPSGNIPIFTPKTLNPAQ